MPNSEDLNFQGEGKLRSYAKATHFGPTLLVCCTTLILALTQFSLPASLEIVFAILCGQCTVGWSNDLIDLESDRLANRMKKPLVAGNINAQLLSKLIFVALLLAIVFSFIGPLGITGGLIHLLGIGSAMAYNFWLKRTVFSFLPYLISFGAMPWAIYCAKNKIPPIWLYSAFAIFTVGFHFVNVIKDMDSDREQLIMGLPQRLGTKLSVAIATILFLCGTTLVLMR